MLESEFAEKSLLEGEEKVLPVRKWDAVVFEGGLLWMLQEEFVAVPRASAVLCYTCAGSSLKPVVAMG